MLTEIPAGRRRTFKELLTEHLSSWASWIVLNIDRDPILRDLMDRFSDYMYAAHIPVKNDSSL